MPEQNTGLGNLLGVVGVVTGFVVGWNATEDFWAAVIAAVIGYFVGVSIGNTLHKVIAVIVSILLIVLSTYIRQELIGAAVRGVVSQQQSRTYRPAPESPRRPRALPAATPAARGTDASCRLYNDRMSEATVYVRRACDVYDCDADASTIIRALPDNTRVRPTGGARVRSKVKPFAWVEVEVIETGETVWAADTKVRCDRG